MRFFDRYHNVPHGKEFESTNPSMTEKEGFVSAYDRIQAIMYSGSMISQIPANYYDFYGEVNKLAQEIADENLEIDFRTADDPVLVKASLDRAQAILNARKTRPSTDTPSAGSVQPTAKESVADN